VKEMASFYTQDELGALGLKRCGEKVYISKKCSLYAAEAMSIGSNVRIDDFCILSGNIVLGSYIHISAYTSLFSGKHRVILEDFTTVSSRCAIYAESDDYSGESPNNPMLPEGCRTTYGGDVILRRYVIIGSGCTVLPGLTIGEGVAIGAMSLVTKDVPEWGIYAGVPCRRLKERSRKLLEKIPSKTINEVP